MKNHQILLDYISVHKEADEPYLILRGNSEDLGEDCYEPYETRRYKLTVELFISGEDCDLLVAYDGEVNASTLLSRTKDWMKAFGMEGKFVIVIPDMEISGRA